MAVLQRLGELDLTDEQREKIKKLQEDFRTKMQEDGQEMRKLMQGVRDFREKNPDDREGFRKKMQEMREKMAPLREAHQGFIEEIKGVLNEDQLKKFNEMLAQGGRCGPGGRMGRRGRGGLPGLDPRTMEQLDLTDEQKDKIKGLLQRFTEEQKELVEKYEGLFKALLTPEQAEKFEKAQAESKERMANLRNRRRRGEGPEGGVGGGRRPRRRPRRDEDEGGDEG